MAGKNDEYTSMDGAHDLSSEFEAKTRWLNCFVLCAKALKHIGKLMIAFVVGIVMLSWCCVVLLRYGPMALGGGQPPLVGDSTKSVVKGILVVVLYSVQIGMILWSYFATVYSPPGKVPYGWHPFERDEDVQQALIQINRSDYVLVKGDPTRPRYCRKCQAWKPERSHHCSASKCCILKLDHYCVWVLNAVGLLNYKFFLLFLLHTFVGALWGLYLLAAPFAWNLKASMKARGAPYVVVAIVMDSLFTICLGGFMIMHANLVAANCTTIEMYEKHRIQPWPYNRGLRRNFMDIFFSKPWRWLLPFYSKEEQRMLLDSCLGQRASSASLLGAHPRSHDVV